MDERGTPSLRILVPSMAPNPVSIVPMMVEAVGMFHLFSLYLVLMAIILPMLEVGDDSSLSLPVVEVGNDSSSLPPVVEVRNESSSLPPATSTSPPIDVQY
ncbi:hypothetical protein Adt_14840 [Abeliophyllum distichum]|uniref:Transmembrane protein n=1 Tax=Abeliophyllum distichum TaxID=126358 RepID=A0ABD1U0S3_9LAMI